MNLNNLLKICVGIALFALVAIFIFKVPLNNVFLFGAVLLCPLMHLFMMNHGGHTEKNSNDHSNHS
ncbi:hypothetical protein B6D29_03305 [Microgenomates bacterium UTCPR1]|nr:MAG: hypothetical protein B6D29_03305 [Microgenomates bacterium UTCPR1]